MSMRIKRNHKVCVPTSYNELAELVNSKRPVIFIKGKLYDEIISKAKETKINRSNKTIGCVALAAGVLTGGTLAIILGAVNLAFGTVLKNKDFEDYKVKINKKEKRIELYVNKGPDKYDPRYDTIEF